MNNDRYACVFWRHERSSITKLSRLRHKKPGLTFSLVIILVNFGLQNEEPKMKLPVPSFQEREVCPDDG